MKNNKLIAEFIGRCGKNKKYLYTFKGIGKVMKGTIWYTIEDAKFHYDWNWLMIVVEKIEELGYFAMIETNRTQISFNNEENNQINVSNLFRGEYANTYKTKIKGVYLAVIKFINWYNKK